MRILKGHKKQVRALAYTPDGTVLASASNDHTVRLWDPTTGEERASLRGHTRPVLAVAFSPDGRLLASGGYDQVVRLWDTATGQPRGTLGKGRGWGHLADDLTSLAFAPEGQTLAVGCGSRDYSVLSGELRLWDARAKRLIMPRLYEGGVWCLGYAAATGLLAVGTGRNTLVVWDKGTTQELAVLQQKTGVKCLAITPDGRTLAAAAGWLVNLWDVPDRRVRVVLKGHKAAVWAMAFTPDGRTLATGSWDNTVRLWDVAAGRERAAFDWEIGKIHAVTFAPDGMTAAVGGDRRDIVIWDVDDTL